MYHVFALCRCTSCSAVANTRWRRPLTVRSFCRKFSGMCCSSRLKLRSVGSVGLRLWRSLLACRAINTGFGNAGQGALVNSSRRT